MPLARYNALHGGNAAKAMRELRKRYGRERGTRIFYAMTNDRRSGSNGMRGVLRGRAKRAR